MCGLQTSSAITGQGRGDLRVERRGLLGLDEKAEFPTLPWPSHWLQNAGRSSWRVSGMEEGEDLFQNQELWCASQLPTILSKKIQKQVMAAHLT